MKSANPLDTLIEESRKARDQAGQTLARDRQGQQQAALQLDTLQRYRQEYRGRLQGALERGLDAITLDNYRRFILSLDDAIDRAGENLQQHGRQVSASQQDWRERQTRLASYDTLASRRARREQQQQTRREQRHNDELGNRAHARQRTGGPDAH